MAPSKTDLSDVIRTTDAALTQHAATPSSLDTVLHGQRTRMAGAGPVPKPDLPLLTPSVDKTMRGPVGMERGKLPPGISGGKVAAIVAGVALAGGALYWLTRKKEPAANWAARVDASRLDIGSGVPSR